MIDINYKICNKRINIKFSFFDFGKMANNELINL